MKGTSDCFFVSLGTKVEYFLLAESLIFDHQTFNILPFIPEPYFCLAYRILCVCVITEKFSENNYNIYRVHTELYFLPDSFHCL